MGYPMTYQRVIHRNRIYEGGYDADPTVVEPRMTADARGRLDVWRTLAEHAYEQLDAHRRGRNALLGDLRRLEEDTQDEGATCRYIADRTGIDPEIVAAVLKEFISW